MAERPENSCRRFIHDSVDVGGGLHDTVTDGSSRRWARMYGRGKVGGTALVTSPTTAATALRRRLTASRSAPVLEELAGDQVDGAAPLDAASADVDFPALRSGLSATESSSFETGTADCLPGRWPASRTPRRRNQRGRDQRLSSGLAVNSLCRRRRQRSARDLAALRARAARPDDCASSFWPPRAAWPPWDRMARARSSFTGEGHSPRRTHSSPHIQQRTELDGRGLQLSATMTPMRPYPHSVRPRSTSARRANRVVMGSMHRV